MAYPANILIVDDNERNRNLLNKIIVALKHIPLLAEDGLSALAQIEKLAPDLVLLDILMPEMDGYEVLECLKSSKDLRHIPVIMISAVDELESVVRCIEKGADDYLIKPFNPTLLQARINACLEKKKLHDEEQRLNTKLMETLEQLRKTQKELVESKRTEAMLEMAVNVAHEINNPLAVIGMNAEMIMKKIDNNDLDYESFKLIKENIKRISDFVKSIQNIRDHKFKIDPRKGNFRLNDQ
jgi:PleD family two-component response regulator